MDLLRRLVIKKEIHNYVVEFHLFVDYMALSTVNRRTNMTAVDSNYFNVLKFIIIGKLSILRVNEGKQQSKQFTIYNLDSIARVNERKQKRRKK